ncbi:hypothetical protein [Serratia liquefaciens]|uniref:hypothetical protein n=1 Tax=Serratia liquefaciens TaxID=614 RepID=UPI001020B616|nr:hypothetical protein [Serratia liquefaciens]MDU4173058.1 hypothetical protein [Serratia liquefaciens]QIC86703.1 hypothetical protein F0336_09815 [Serratia liquefaciens]RYM73150.1 hypothetical protein BSQ99_04020 [Serratia liquefaciens]HEJ7946302.1 hypothetical protein [Serratia liquefaciens]HEJ7989732.1 hypothetical protein [Serratia liquefaciens]
MKRIFLACVAQWSCFSLQASVDWQYHAAQPLDNKISEEYQQKRSGLKHKVWSAEGVTLANEKALELERQRAAAEQANRQQLKTLYGEYHYPCGKRKQEYRKLCNLPRGMTDFPGHKRHP